MGWYLHYDIEFENTINWCDEIVKNELREYDCRFLYLRDLVNSRVIVSIYSQYNITDVLNTFTKLYSSKMRYKNLGGGAWVNWM